MNRVLIFGNGWLGNRVGDGLRESQDVKISSCDILDVASVKKEVLKFSPSLVINAAGVCGKPNIDWCNASEYNRRITRYVNEFGPRILLDAIRSESDAKFIHFSSGCLWDDAENVIRFTYSEPEPPSFYSQTKANGEKGIFGRRDVCIFRIRMPISDRPHPRNLIDKLANYENVIAVPNSVTIVEKMIEELSAMVLLRGRFHDGIFHSVHKVTDAAELMRWYVKIIAPEHRFNVISLDSLYDRGFALERRSNCKLSASWDGTPNRSTAWIEELMQRYRQHLDE